MSTATAQTRSRFLDLQALASLAHMRFATRHQIEGGYSGRHRSRQQGGAGEFADYREYVEGEDLRRLDWKVLARTGRAYTRIYQDETNLLCTLVIDASASMQFSGDGQPRGSKLEYVQYLSTALSHIIGRQQDQAGLAVIADGLREFLPTGSTAGHIAQLHDAIERIRPQPRTDLDRGLRDLFDRMRRRGVLLIMSDFLVDDLEASFAPVRLFRHRHCEVVILHIVHPAEERLPAGVAYRFEGMENDGRVDCSPEEIRAGYEQRFEAHAATVRTLSLACGCDYRRISTGVGYMQTLGTFLVERAG
jgi:uncharacterized protein (DUF58 family)